MHINHNGWFESWHHEREVKNKSCEGLHSTHRNRPINCDQRELASVKPIKSRDLGTAFLDVFCYGGEGCLGMD